MPTLRGWALTGAGFALLLLWYLFGDAELLLSGSFFIVAQLAAIAYVRFHSPNLSLSRLLGSPSVQSGDSATVTILLHNSGTRTMINISVEDEVKGLGSATFELARLGTDEHASATYRVSCRPRGVYQVGPTRATTTDPLAMAELSSEPGPIHRLVVYPVIEELRHFPIVRGQDSSVQASRPDHSHRRGEDFFSLREFQSGDDMRRVHWPSSAKTDELMIRQLETPLRSRALVLLDVRAGAYESSDAFEKAVSGAASVLTHLVGAGFDCDLWAGTPNPVDASNYTAAMERLALVAPTPDIDIEAAAARFSVAGGGGALILICGNADRALLSVSRLLAAQYSTTVLMAASSTGSQTLPGFQHIGATMIGIDPDELWAGAWLAAMRSSWNVVAHT